MNKNILQKLSSLNSSQEHKIELGLVDDFENESNQIIQLAKADIKKVLDALDTAKFQVEVLNEVPKRSVALLKKYDELQVKSKELGITLPNNLSNLIKELKPLSTINTSKVDNLIKSAASEINNK